MAVIKRHKASRRGDFKMYYVYFVNLGFPSQESFATVEQAKAYGKAKGFDFCVATYTDGIWKRVN